MNAETLQTIFIASGISGVTMGFVFQLFLKNSIKSSIQHQYNQLMEVRKTEEVLLQKRFDVAVKALEALDVLYVQIQEGLNGIPNDGPKQFRSQLRSQHSGWRKKYHIIRSQLEMTNDLLSSYSLEFDNLLHPENIKRLISEAEITNTSDVKWLYRKLWNTMSESLRALMRSSSHHDFWKSHNYGDRSDVWAEFDRMRIEEFVVSLKKPGADEHEGFFYLTLEETNGVKRFWGELPEKNH